MPPTPLPPYLLDTPLVPKAYHIELHASPKRRGFQGTVTLNGRLSRASDTLLLHARGLKVTHVVATQGGYAYDGRARLDAANQVLTLRFGEALGRGPITLEMDFKGQLSESMHGIYLAQDGPERAIVSQCEASDARAIFPCIDEPAQKARFAWTVVTDAGLTVITNGALKSETPEKGDKKRVRHVFGATKVMSTYLCAVTIGALEASATRKVGKTPCRIWAGQGKVGQTGFAMEVTQKVLPWYADYFGTPYAYGKLDQVAVPGFDAGAMENVGAVFYRQNLLLMQPGQTSFAGQKRIAEVIAHEIAHQWFGNLVTMQWWDDLWLNEAFATWMAYTVCDALYPDWHIWDDYLEGKEAALVADGLRSTHPIYNPVHNPSEATELFDVITYEKGCGVLRMCEHYLGKKTFRQGIRAYIAAFANSNARGEDLWEALSVAAKRPVATLMHDWIHRPGHPLVRATLKKGTAQPTLTVTQRRFDAQRGALGELASHDQSLWQIPMVVVYDAGDGVQEHRVLFDQAQMDITLPCAARAKLQWAYINHDATGFYRSQLDQSLQGALLRHGTQALSAGARMALVQDQWALTRSLDGAIDELMPLLVQLGRDQDPGVFRSVSGRLRALWAHVVDEADRPRLEALVRTLCRPHFERLGDAPKKGESLATTSLRASVIDLLGGIGKDAEILARAQVVAHEEAQDPGAVDANLAGSWVALAASTGDRKRLGQLLEVYQARKKAGAAPEHASRYLYALCAFDKKGPIEDVLAMTIDGTIPQEQLRVVLSTLLVRRASGPIAWAFLKKNWAAIGPRVGGMGIARLVESTGALPYRLKKDVQAFFTKNPVPEAERAIKKAMEAFEVWHALKQHHAAKLGQWLQAHQPEQE